MQEHTRPRRARFDVTHDNKMDGGRINHPSALKAQGHCPTFLGTETFMPRHANSNSANHPGRRNVERGKRAGDCRMRCWRKSRLARSVQSSGAVPGSVIEPSTEGSI